MDDTILISNYGDNPLFEDQNIKSGMYLSFSILYFILMIFTLYVGYKVFKIIRFNNILLLSMLICLNISCILNFVCDLLEFLYLKQILVKTDTYLVIKNVFP